MSTSKKPKPTVDVPNISIVNASHVMPDYQLEAWMPAFQKYVDQYVGPAWDVGAKLHFVPFAERGHADHSHWWIVIKNHSDVDGALGYHDIHPKGLPYALIFAGDDLKYGASVPTTLTHELAEMLGDPSADQTVEMPFPGHGKVMVAKELCDAVEADNRAMRIDGVACSNFVLPSYFEAGSEGPWDHQKVLKGAFPHLDHGGYMEFEFGSQWHQITARLADGTRSYRSGRIGRGVRRATREG